MEAPASVQEASVAEVCRWGWLAPSPRGVAKDDVHPSTVGLLGRPRISAG